MPKPIKFRAWNGRGVVPVVLLNFENQEAQVEATRTEPASSGNTYVSYKWISFDNVMQFTGLFDKNGKEIYEGDIVSSIAEKAHRDQDGDNVVYAKINEGKWGLACVKSFINDGRIWHNGLDFDWGGWIEHEVIGNIYEHPHLLTQ